MSNLKSRLLRVMLAAIMILSMIVLPGITVSAATEGLDAIPAAHRVYEGAYNTFSEGVDMVSDPEANGGMAAHYSMGNTPALNIFRYDAGTQESSFVGSASRNDLKINEGYYVYKFTCVVPANATTGAYVFLCADWMPQNTYLGAAMGDYAGQTVDLYFSIKITGPNDNNYDMYIDRAVLVTACSLDSSADNPDLVTTDATCMSDTIQSGPCSVCGNTVEVTLPFTKVDHSFTSYTTEEDGSQVSECDFGCGKTDVIEPLEPETDPAGENTPADGNNSADENKPADESKPAGQSKPTDTNTSGGSVSKTLIVLIVIGVAFLALHIVSLIVVLKTGKKKISLILIAIATVLLIAVVILFLTGTLSINELANGHTGNSSEETIGGSEQNKPSTPALTEENALNLNNMQVVLPAEPTDVESNAAKELVDYVEKMTGKVIPVVNEGAAVEAGIYVGDTEFAKTNNVTHPSSEYGEGWAIKAVDGNLVLCGDSVRGTLYAVYHLLEDALGVHWWTYTEEYVPSVESALVWNEYDNSGAPAFKYREMYPGEYRLLENMFHVRNRMNGPSAYPPEGFGGVENYGSPNFVHTFSFYVPNSMFSERPEWFALVEGERAINGQLCLTNEELLSYMTNKLLEYIATDIEKYEAAGIALPRWYAIVPGDMDMFCECENCVAAIEKSGLSGYLLQFVNAMAEVVAVEYPDVLVDTLAYWHYIEPPLDDTKPADNVVIRFAWNGMDIFHSASHKNNEEMMQWAQRWFEITKEGQYFWWDYLTTYRNSGPATFMYKFPDHFQTLLEAGFSGYFGEMENPIDTDFWDMKMWLCAKLLEDPYQDFEALLDTFLNGYYGVAAPYVREYLDFAEGKIAADEFLNVQFGEATDQPKWLDLEDAIAVDEIFNKAFEAASGNERLLMRLRYARSALDRALLERYAYYEHQAETQGITLTFDRLTVCQRLVDCIHEQLELRGQYDLTVTGQVNDTGWVAKYEDLLSRLQANQ